MSKLIIGCGYLGIRLGKRWSEDGEEVWATTRSHGRTAQFSSFGFQPLLLDVTNPTDCIDIPEVETIVFAVGFDRTGLNKIEEVYVEGLRNVVAQCSATLKTFIYISSTGVYGQTDGDWVDEESLCQPTRAGGKACLAAEQLLKSNEQVADKSLILRLAGIYGPERLPQAAKLVQGEPLHVAAEGYLNLIHVDDIVEIVRKCDSLPTPQTLCISDGEPVLRRDFYQHLAKLLKTKPPVFAPPQPGSSQAERARGSKRISNRRLREIVSPQLAYPSFREGLAAIVGEQNQN